jgi:hypothetical protein
VGGLAENRAAESQLPGTAFPEAETGPEKGRDVSAETDKAEIGAKKARHTRAILRGLGESQNY